MNRGSLTSRWGGSVGRAAPVLVFGLLTATVLAGWLGKKRFTTYEIAGNSMLPTFSPGDYLMVDLAAYRRTAPRRGEVVLVQDPSDAGRTLVKRIGSTEPNGRVWLVGDNPAESTDSRAFGPVPVSLIAGRVVWRYWRSRRRRPSH